MLRLGGALLLVSAMAAVALGDGKVVRIERVRAKPVIAPLLCEVRADLSGQCIGGKPAVGDIVTVVNNQRVVAQVRVLESNAHSNSCDALWRITTEKVSGDLTAARGGETLGVVDPSVDSRAAKRRSDPTDMQVPSADPNVRPVFGIDREGNGDADIVLAYSSCGAASSSGMPECLEIWTRRERTMVRSWVSSLKNCY